MLRIFLISVFLIFSNLAFGKYISFLDSKSELIISQYLGKKFLIGNANYSFLFWDIYDAELYSTSNKYNSNELAIILKYNRSIDKETLIRETMNDIKEQKNISNQQEEDWKSHGSICDWQTGSRWKSQDTTIPKIHGHCWPKAFLLTSKCVISGTFSRTFQSMWSTFIW